MRKAGVKVLRGDKWHVEEDLILSERKVYVLKNEELRVEIIWLYHNILAAGHRGRQKIEDDGLVTRKYQQPGIMRDVGKYMDDCDIYQRIKN